MWPCRPGFRPSISWCIIEDPRKWQFVMEILTRVLTTAVPAGNCSNIKSNFGLSHVFTNKWHLGSGGFRLRLCAYIVGHRSVKLLNKRWLGEFLSYSELRKVGEWKEMLSFFPLLFIASGWASLLMGLPFHVDSGPTLHISRIVLGIMLWVFILFYSTFGP